MNLALKEFKEGKFSFADFQRQIQVQHMQFKKQANDKLALKNFIIESGLPHVEGVSTNDPDNT